MSGWGRIMTGRVLILLLVAGGGVCTPSMTAAEEAEQRKRTAKVIERTSSLVYIDAGRADGLQEGDSIEILREGKSLLVLQVTFLSSHRASCDLKDASNLPEVGDTARFTPHETALPAATQAGSKVRSGVPRGAGWFRRHGIRGRVGLRYLTIRDHSETGGDFSQPALDVLMLGNEVGGSPFDFAMDVRGRRTYNDLPDGERETVNLNRVYRMSATWREREVGLGVTAGRQYSPLLTSVNIFDGVLIDLDRDGWGVGGFSGTQPDPIDNGYSSSIREHGLFMQFHNRPGERRHWLVATGAVGSYQEGEVNREFLFLQSRYAGPRLSMFLIQEVDYNRDWKTEFEDSTFSGTSTFFNAQFRASESVTLRAGYDNRRRIRLYRDRVTPETEFDDSNRLGAQVGLSWRSPIHYRVSMDARSNRGDTSMQSDAYTLNLGAVSFTRQNIGLTTRTTSYANERAEGWLHSAQVGMNLGTRVRLELGGGIREETTLEVLQDESRISWTSIDVDLNLGRRWYLLLSGEQNRSEVDRNDQLYASLTYRF